MRVVCTAVGSDTEVEVTYDLTATGPAGEQRLPTFEAGFAQVLEEWRVLSQPHV